MTDRFAFAKVPVRWRPTTGRGISLGLISVSDRMSLILLQSIKGDDLLIESGAILSTLTDAADCTRVTLVNGDWFRVKQSVRQVLAVAEASI